MRDQLSYSTVLTHALTLIERGDISTADLLVNNYYHRQKRSRKDFVHLLSQTTSHPAYVKASDITKNELARTLYLLDKKHNTPSNSIHVVYIEEEASDGIVTILFSIQEKKSTPAQ